MKKKNNPDDRTAVWKSCDCTLGAVDKRFLPGKLRPE
jgi:hypothetical protein